MATTVRNGIPLNLELGGQPAGLLRSLQPPPYRLDRVEAAMPGGTVIRAGSLVTVGEMAAQFSPGFAGPLRDWAQGFASGDRTPRNGVAQVLDFKLALRRSLAFDDAEITQLRLPTLAADSKQPVLLSLSWRMQALRDSAGDGRDVTVAKGRDKAMLTSNFRVTGLPFDGAGVSRVSLPLLRRVGTAADPQRPQPRAGALDIGELTLTVTGRSRDKALAWVQQVVADGRLADEERIDIVVELLDAALKAVLVTVQLAGCRLLACDEPVIEPSAELLPGLVLRLSVDRVALDFAKG